MTIFSSSNATCVWSETMDVLITVNSDNVTSYGNYKC